MNNPAYRASRSGRRNRILEKLLSDILVPDSYDGVGEVYIEIVGCGDCDDFYPIEVFKLRYVFA